MDELIQKIRDYQYLSDNHKKESEEFLLYLYTLGDIVPPYISTDIENEELNFFWQVINEEFQGSILSEESIKEKYHFLLDLGFYGDGLYSYYGVYKGEEFIEDGTSINTALPPKLIEAIRL